MLGNQNNLRNIVIWLIIGLLVLALVNLLSDRAPQVSMVEIPISQVVEDARAGRPSPHHKSAFLHHLGRQH